MIVLFMMMSNPLLFAQQTQTVRGTITGDFNETIPGVTIRVKGTDLGTVSDTDGKFSIAASPTDTLAFSFIGYVTQEVLVGNRSTIDVVMVTDVKDLDEVIVIGYGTEKKSHLTGAISKVTNEIPFHTVGSVALIG